MTVSIPPELQEALAARASQRQTTPEVLVRQAFAWYLTIDPDLLDEFDAWQEIRDEALQIVDRPPE